MKKPAKKSKRIIVNEIEFWWKVTGTMFILWGDTIKKQVITLPELTGLSWDYLERASYKGYWPEIKPSYIANWIKENILNGKN